MSSARWIELLSGGAAGLVGLGVLLFVLFGPVYGTASSSCTGGPDGSSTCTTTSYGHASLLQHGLDSTTAFFLGLLACILAGVAYSAMLHARSGSVAARAVLWALGVLLLIFTCIGAASIGLFLLPSLLLAWVAVVASFGNDAQALV